MPDSDWQEMPASERSQWDQDYASGGMSGARTTTQEERLPNGAQKKVTIEIWSYPVFTPQGSDQPFQHKCIRCHGRHDHYLVDPNTLLRPDIVYEPAHVADNQWGVGTATVYPAVTVTGTMVHRTQTEVRRGNQPPLVTVKWEEKVLDHVEQRDYVVVGGWDEVIDCATEMRVRSFGYLARPGEDILVASVGRIPGLGAEAQVLDRGGVIGLLDTAIAAAEKPALVYALVEKKPALVLIDQAHNGKQLGHVQLEVPRRGGRVVLLGFTRA